MLTIQTLAGPHQTARLSALKKNSAWRWDKFKTFLHHFYHPQHFTQLFLIISDIIGFSAVRASGFSRVGESRIFFENTVRDHELQKHFTAWISSEKNCSYFQNLDLQVEWQVTDSGYGWDRSLSLFVCHKAGLYFFTFSVKADADQGDNYKYE